MTLFYSPLNNQAGQCVELQAPHQTNPLVQALDSSTSLTGRAFSTVKYVDVGTTTPVADQNGSAISPFSTVQRAVNASLSNGAIYIAPGDYSAESVTITGKTLALVMEGGPLAATGPTSITTDSLLELWNISVATVTSTATVTLFASSVQNLNVAAAIAWGDPADGNFLSQLTTVQCTGSFQGNGVDVTTLVCSDATLFNCRHTTSITCSVAGIVARNTQLPSLMSILAASTFADCTFAGSTPTVDGTGAGPGVAAVSMDALTYTKFYAANGTVTNGAVVTNALDNFRLIWGAQASWGIDPVNGNDSFVGTAAKPLKTMAEFNRRMQNTVVTVAQTLALVGNVIDAQPTLSGTLYASGASLTVSGTRTDVATGTLSSHAAVGPGWQLTTAGINWTLQQTSSQVRFSTGQVAMLAEIVDANNAIVGELLAPLTGGSVVPTDGSTVTVATLSRLPNPVVNAAGQGSLTAQHVVIQHVTFDAANTSGGASLQGGAHVQLYGCVLQNNNTYPIGTTFNARACKFQITNFSFACNAGSGIATTTGCVAGGSGSTLLSLSAGIMSWSGQLHTGCKIACNSSNLLVDSCHVRNTAGPVSVAGQAQLQIINGGLTGSVGNTGVGITVANGKVTYVGAGNKPTVTGGSDTSVGGVARTYAQIPFTALQLDAIPPTVTTLTGNGSAIVQE